VLSFHPVQSVVKTLELLAEVNRTSLATVGELHKRTGLPKPTIVRLLETLMAAGYVVRDERMRGYQGTSAGPRLSAGYLLFCPEEERQILRAAMRTSSDPENRSLTDEDLERMITQARFRGYTDRDSNVEPRNSDTIAVPLMQGERVVATFGVTYFRSVVTTPEDRARIIHPLKKAAANIEAQLEQLSAPLPGAFQDEK